MTRTELEELTESQARVAWLWAETYMAMCKAPAGHGRLDAYALGYAKGWRAAIAYAAERGFLKSE